MKMSCCVVVCILCCSFSAFAQLPTGALFHLQGDVGIVDSVGKVAEWHDAANPQIKFFAPSAVSQPTHSATMINGHKAVTFDGVTNYLEGPPIFPINKDYTICVVAKTTNYSLYNNIVSGTTHAFFLSQNIYPRFLHANFNSIATSTSGVTAGWPKVAYEARAISVRPAREMVPPVNGAITSTATSWNGLPANEAIFSGENFGQLSGRYNPPSRARPARIASSKLRVGAWPRVEMYCKAGPSFASDVCEEQAATLVRCPRQDNPARASAAAAGIDGLDYQPDPASVRLVFLLSMEVEFSRGVEP